MSRYANALVVVGITARTHARNHNILGLREDVNLFLRGQE